jgi:hypothetical protein
MSNTSKKYHKPKSIVKMIYGVDIDSYCVYTTKEVISKILNVSSDQLNIIQHDFTQWNTTMKFNVIVGNPPFQAIKTSGDRNDQASNLWSKFWGKCFEITDTQSYIGLVTPTSWLSPSADFRGKPTYIDDKDRLWDVFNQYDTCANVNDVSIHFKGVGSTFGYAIVNRSGNSGLKFSDGADTKLGFLPKSGYDIVIKELDATNNLISNFTIDQDNTLDYRVSIPMTRAVTSTSVEILSPNNPKPTSGSDKERLYVYVHVTDAKEAQKVYDRVIACSDILNTHCRWSGFINIKIVHLISYS